MECRMDGTADPLLEQLLAQIASLERRVGELEAQNRLLRKSLDEAHAVAARQAAPFRGRESKKVSKTPGPSQELPRDVSGGSRLRRRERRGATSGLSKLRRTGCWRRSGRAVHFENVVGCFLG
jgi:hypothetical protein